MQKVVFALLLLAASGTAFAQGLAYIAVTATGGGNDSNIGSGLAYIAVTASGGGSGTTGACSAPTGRLDLSICSNAFYVAVIF